MAPSIYDDSFLTEEQKRQIEAFQAEYQRALAAGDHEAMDAAHAAAERVRAGQGYSGGADGFGYEDLRSEGAYYPSVLPSYEAQVDAVNSTYDAAREAQLAGLKNAFDANTSVLEAEREAIPEIYQGQKNDLAAQSEVAGRSFNEYAAASGLNSGTAGQAQLARSNQLQGNMAALGRQEAKAQSDIENEAARLKIQYQNDIAQAIADGEFQRAAALLQEYQRAAESAVASAQAQADENFRVYQSQLAQRQWQAEMDYRKERDAVSDSQWQQKFDYQKSQDALAASKASTISTSGTSGGADVKKPVPDGGTTDSSSSVPWDMDENGELKTWSQAGTLYGLLTHVPGDYYERLDRIEAGVKSGQISPEAGNYLLRVLATSPYVYNRPVEKGKATSAAGSGGGGGAFS